VTTAGLLWQNMPLGLRMYGQEMRLHKTTSSERRCSLSRQPTSTRCAPPSVLTSISFAGFSLFEILKTFTATVPPFCVPR